MSFNSDSDSNLNIMGCAFRENHGGLINSKVPFNMIRRRMAEQLATKLTEDCMQVTKEKYSTEYRLQVYVLTPDQLEKYVQRRAEQLSPYRPCVVEIQPVEVK